MTQAFSGIRILDFTQVLAGPFGVMQLALLGAEVIKIEQPGTGDQTRGLMNAGGHTDMSPSFMTCNLNKKSLTLNLKTELGQDIVRKLVVKADAVVENFKAGTMERLGLGYEDLRKINPALVYCSVTGYGQKGPRAGLAAYDGAIQAASGMMSQTGYAETGPTRTGYMPVDMSTALNTAFALSSALYRKATTGEGQRIDVAMMDTAIVAQAAQYSNYLNQGNLVGLQGNASPTRQPTANVFATLDGYIQITAIRQPQVEKLFAALGMPEKLDEPGFNSPEARVANPEEVHDVVTHALSSRTTQVWMSVMEPMGIPVAEVRTLPEVMEDEQFQYRKVFRELDSPIKEGEKIIVVTSGYETSEDGPDIHSPPPHIGQHSHEILHQLGYSADEVAMLESSGVI